MTIESEHDLKALTAVGRLVAVVLKAMLEAVKPGVTTADLDALGAELLQKYGARSAPIAMYKFPAATCISLNDEAAHGIPSAKRVIREGDLVNIDVSAEMGGYYGDTGASMTVGAVTPKAQKLCDVTRSALEVALSTAKAGVQLNAVGRAVENYVRSKGLTVIRNLPGHGIGRSLHEAPSVWNYFDKKNTQKLHEGMVITLEPFVSTRANHIIQANDKWTLRTPDGSLCAQFEHTVVITKDRPLILTQA
jgi:methionyl aminopeptidase